MKISILIPTYCRPRQMGEALASIAAQDRSLIGEVIIGDDSLPQFWPQNRAVAEASEIAALIDYVPSSPPRGNYPNQCFLGERARSDYLLILHDDDQLCPSGLALLAAACSAETDPRVQIWFGQLLIMDEDGRVDPQRSAENNWEYGRTGSAAARPVWEWSLTNSIPQNSFLVSKRVYMQHMRGEDDCNVGDWGFSVRLANSGAWGRFIAKPVSRYRSQAVSVTNSGRGMDVHRWYEIGRNLVVPPGCDALKRHLLSKAAMVAVVRYLRDGERLSAWRCFLSRHWTWRQRISMRGGVTLAMLLLPSMFWRWGLRQK